MNVSRISPLSFNGTLTLSKNLSNEVSIDTDDIEEISASENFSHSEIFTKDKRYCIYNKDYTNNIYCIDAMCAAAHSALLNSYIAAKNSDINVKYPVQEVKEHTRIIRRGRTNGPIDC